MSLATSAASRTTLTLAGRSLIRPKGVTAPGITPSFSARSSGLPKERRRAADPRVEVLEVDLGILEHDDEEDRVLLVLEEQVLGVGAGNRAAKRPALLDREERRMLDGRGRDVERSEEGEKLGAAGGHFQAGMDSRSVRSAAVTIAGGK